MIYHFPPVVMYNNMAALMVSQFCFSVQTSEHARGFAIGPQQSRGSTYGMIFETRRNENTTRRLRPSTKKDTQKVSPRVTILGSYSASLPGPEASPLPTRNKVNIYFEDNGGERRHDTL